MILNDRQRQAVLDILDNRLFPGFVYFVTNTDFGDALEIVASYAAELDEYNTRLIELEIMQAIGADVSLYRTADCDNEFLSEVLDSGYLVQCRDELTRHRFLNELAMRQAQMHSERRMLINRMRECESMFLQ